MKKNIFIIVTTILLFGCLTTNDIEMNASANEYPMYGNIEKTEEMKLADKEFVNKSIEAAGSVDKAVEYYLEKAWLYYYEGDYSTSMKRFNQCWLLDPNNYEVYWGFGLLLGIQNKLPDCIKMLNKSLEINPDNSRAIVDLAYAYTLYSLEDNVDDNNDYLNKALDLYEKSEAYDEPFLALYNNWAVALMITEQYKEALDKLLKAEKLGFDVNAEFKEELKNKINS